MTRLYAAAIALLCLALPVHAKPQIKEGGQVSCDNRYPWTCDNRGWMRDASPFRHSARGVRAKPAHLRRLKASSHRHARMARPAAALSRGAAVPGQAKDGLSESERLERPSRSLHGVIGPLAEKAEQIMRVCGSWIMSAVRHTQVAGSGRLSCHAYGKAVDIAGNPACIYRMLRGFPGGYSTDYSTVRCRGVRCPHVHVSLNCSEDGKRFVHHNGRRRKS